VKKFSEAIKSQLSDLYQAYSTKAGSDMTEAMKNEVKGFLAYLTASNGVVSAEEVDFINKYLDTNFRTRDLASYITTNNIFSHEYATSLPYAFRTFLDDEALSRQYITVMHAIGKECVIADQKAESAEVDSLNDRMETLTKAFDQRYPDRPITLAKDTIQSVQQKEEESSAGGENKDEETLDQLLKELDELIGLTSVKKNVYSLLHLQEIQMERVKRGIPKIPISNHLIFTGNPGTGKTTVARLLGKIYYKIGLLPNKNFVEVDRSGMVAGYVGQTAIEVKNVFDSAKGGVLFIDEAYSLANGLPGDYGTEAIETLLKRMEDNRDQIVVIVAGYPELMEQFLKSNPGLMSRFSKKIYFPDYTPEELVEILKYIAKKNQCLLSDDALAFAADVFKRKYDQRDENFANAREVRNFFEAGVVSQADRLYGKLNLTDEELRTLTAEDFRYNELSVEN